MVGDGCTSMWRYLVTRNCPLKRTKMMYFMCVSLQWRVQSTRQSDLQEYLDSSSKAIKVKPRRLHVPLTLIWSLYPRAILRPESLYFPWPSVPLRVLTRMRACAQTQTDRQTHTHIHSLWGPWRHNLETGLARIRAPGPAHVSLTQKTALHGEKATHSPLTKRIINPDSPRKLGV